MANVIFEDIFHVISVNPEGKAFDLCDRLHCESETYKMHLILDVHSNFFKVRPQDKFRLVVATSISPNDNEAEDAEFNITTYNDPNPHIDNYDYVMHGKVYRIDTVSAQKAAVYVSYGGLLMRLLGEPSSLSFFQADKKVFLMLKEVHF